MQSGASSNRVLVVRSGVAFDAVEHALADAGYLVQPVDEAEVVAEAAGDRPPALILLGWGASAEAQLRRLVALRPTQGAWVPVVACCDERADVGAALAAGADDFLVASDAATVLARLSVLLRHKARSDMLAGVLDATFDGIVTIDAGGTMLAFNQAASRIFGYEAAEVVGRNVRMLMPEPDRSQHDGYLQRYASTGQPHVIGIGRDVVGQRRSGEVFPMHLQVTAIRRGHDQFFVGIVKDRSAEAQAQSLQQQVMNDDLTGVGSRRHIDETLRQWTRATPGRTPLPFALVFFDLDRFKDVNDRHGHAAGDAVLRAVAARLRHNVGQDDVVGRLAGDEFVVLLRGVARASDALAATRRLLALMAEPVVHESLSLRISASAGLSLCPRDGLSPETLLQHADVEMYRSKRQRVPGAA